MAIAVYFNPENMTLEQFDQTLQRLVAAGAANPAGRLHHSCFGEDGGPMVYDIWKSREAFDAFGATLMPILAELSIDVGEPAIMPLQRLEQTSVSA